MLAAALTWLDASPTRFEAAAWSVSAATAACAAGAALPWGTGRWWRNPAIFAALALFSILAFRWPMLCDNREPENPDESQMMSAAMTLRADPLYWKSVDGQTRGPMDDWALLAVLRTTGNLDYTDARLVGVLLDWTCVVCAWMALRRIFTDGWARLLVLPLLALYAFSDSWSFVQYGTENVADALIALASALVLTAWFPPGQAPSARRLFIAGLALGAVSFAKLQGVPIAAWVAVFAAWQILATGKSGCRMRALAAFLAGGLAVPSAMLLWIASSGIWGDFYGSYIQDNIRYAGARWFSWAQTPAKFWELCGYIECSKPFLLWAIATAGFALLAIPLFSRPHRRPAAFCLGLVVASAYAVMAPGRMFQHYLQFFFFPAGLLAAVAAGSAFDAARRLSASRPGAGRLAMAAVIGAFFGLGLVPQVTWKAHAAQTGLGGFVETRGALERSAVAEAILLHAHAGERLGIWGWGPKFWVQTGLLQATRDGNASRQIDGSPSINRYRERYLSDLVNSRPPVFIDTAGGDNFAYKDRLAAGHEAFGELNAYIRANYRPVGDVEGTRVYVRNDRP